MMMANIELKSDDYNNENFTVAFSRETKESFFELSEIARKTANQWERVSNPSSEDQYRLFAQKVANNSSWNRWSVVKQDMGYLFTYLLLRELPIRNFYARSVIMSIYAFKFVQRYGGNVLGLGITETMTHNTDVDYLME